jgi:hypothetical protein
MSETNRSLKLFYYRTFISRTVSSTKIRADKMKTENEPNTGDKTSRQAVRFFRNSLSLPTFMESDTGICHVPHFKLQLMVCCVFNNDHQNASSQGYKLCHLLINALTYSVNPTPQSG